MQHIIANRLRGAPKHAGDGDRIGDTTHQTKGKRPSAPADISQQPHAITLHTNGLPGSACKHIKNTISPLCQPSSGHLHTAVHASGTRVSIVSKSSSVSSAMPAVRPALPVPSASSACPRQYAHYLLRVFLCSARGRTEHRIVFQLPAQAFEHICIPSSDTHSSISSGGSSSICISRARRQKTTKHISINTNTRR